MGVDMLGSSLNGHLWTIRPWLTHVLRPDAHPAAVPWSTFVDDPKLGPVRLKGLLSEAPGSRETVVVVHGLSGSIESQYVIAAARAAERAGMSCLCLNLRGAPRDGEDLYHVGLTADVHAAIASSALAKFEKLYVLGYSLGGHLALKLATEKLDPRVRAVASVCPPLNLDAAVTWLDAPARVVYRNNILTGLKESFAMVTTRRPELGLPSYRDVRSIQSLRTWDNRVIAPRFGFRNAEHYYAETTVAPHLGEVSRPALVVVAPDDPMIPVHTVRPVLEGEHPLLDVRWVEGGHVGFPPSLDLGLGGELGLEPQALRWLRRAASI